MRKDDPNYRPSGELQGDNKAMPDRGTRTGFTSHDAQTHGKSTSQDATNRMKGIGGATKSDRWDRCLPSKNNG